MSGVADIVELQEERSKRTQLSDHEFQTAGAMLRAAREASGLSYETVEDAINIRPDYLRAIEEMTPDRLPIPAYTTGFVKAYADYLELPTDLLVARFRKEIGYESSHLAPEIKVKEPAEMTGGREMSLIAVVAVLFFVIWVAFQITKPPQDLGPVTAPDTPLQSRPIEETMPTEVVTNDLPADPASQVNAENSGSGNIEEAAGAIGENTEAETAIAAATTSNADATGANSDEAGSTLHAATVPEGSADEALTELGVAREETIAPEEVPVPSRNITDDAVAGVSETASASEPPANSIAADSFANEVAASQELTTAEQLQSRFNDTAFGIVVGEVLNTPTTTTDDLTETPEPAAGDPSTIEPAAPSSTPAPAEESSSAGVTDPVRLRTVAPIYPNRCERRARELETVVVAFDVTVDGRAVNPRISSSTNNCFDRAAISAVSRWSFTPATRNGQSITAYGQTTQFSFRLPE